MEEETTQILVYLCLMHRLQFGYGDETSLQENDCVRLMCQQECPITKMPDALTWSETRSAD